MFIRSGSIQRVTLVLSILLFSIPVFSQFDHYAWSVTKDGSTYNEISTVDLDGNVIVSGKFFSTVDFDPGPHVFNLSVLYSPGSLSNTFLQKLNGNGEFIWAKTLGDGGKVYICNIATDSDGNIIVTGDFEGTVDFDPGSGTFNLTSHVYSDIFVLKLDKYGNFLWVQGMGSNGPFESGVEIEIDYTGNVYVGGYFYNTVDFDPGSNECLISPLYYQQSFLMKLNGNGNFSWARRMAGDAGKSIKMEIDSLSNIYFCSQFSDTAIVGIADTIVSNGLTDISIEKLDSNGNLIWVKSFGGIENEYLNNLVIDHSGNLYFSGNFIDTVDFDPSGIEYNLFANSFTSYLSKFNQAGQFVSVRTFSGDELLYITSLWVDENEHLFVAGVFDQSISVPLPSDPNKVFTSKGSSDIIVLKLNTQLITQDAISFGGKGTDKPLFIHFLDSNNLYVHEENYSESTFSSVNGDYLLPSKNGYYILKMGNSSGGDYRDDFLISSTPNPTTGIVYINKEYMGETAILDTEVEVYVTDYLGQLISHTKSVNNSFEINLTDQPSGMYFITVKHNNNFYLSKCIKVM